MSFEPRYIPKYLNAQPQFLWWEADEATILIGFLVAGRLIDEVLIFIFLGVAIQRIYTKFKNNKQQGYIQHKLYQLGLAKFKSNLKRKKIPFYYIKYFVK